MSNEKNTIVLPNVKREQEINLKKSYNNYTIYYFCIVIAIIIIALFYFYKNTNINTKNNTNTNSNIS